MNLSEKTSLQDLHTFIDKNTFLREEVIVNDKHFNFLMQCISNYPSCNAETCYQVICNPKNNLYYSRIIYNPPETDDNNYKYWVVIDHESTSSITLMNEWKSQYGKILLNK